MGKVVEHRSFEEEIQEKAGEVFEILKENGLFIRQFLFKPAWHIKEERFHWWDTSWMGGGSVIFISPSGNTIDFMVPPASSLLPKIRDVAKQITKRLDLDVHIYPL